MERYITLSTIYPDIFIDFFLSLQWNLRSNIFKKLPTDVCFQPTYLQRPPHSDLHSDFIVFSFLIHFSHFRLRGTIWEWKFQNAGSLPRFSFGSNPNQVIPIQPVLWIVREFKGRHCGIWGKKYFNYLGGKHVLITLTVNEWRKFGVLGLKYTVHRNAFDLGHTNVNLETIRCTASHALFKIFFEALNYLHNQNLQHI